MYISIIILYKIWLKYKIILFLEALSFNLGIICISPLFVFLYWRLLLILSWRPHPCYSFSHFISPVACYSPFNSPLLWFFNTLSVSDISFIFIPFIVVIFFQFLYSLHKIWNQYTLIFKSSGNRIKLFYSMLQSFQ